MSIEAALNYARRGWRVLRILPGEKRPRGGAWQESATTDETTIRSWWADHPTDGVGIATGAASGLWVLDVDAGPGKAGPDSLADLEATYGPLPATVEVVTGSGGRHLYFAWPDDGREIRNDQAGRLGLDLDVRGEGGQVVAPPTIHPTSGMAYEWEASGDPDDGATLAPAPEWLLDLLTRPASEDDERPERRPARSDDEDLPGQRFNASITWPELLEADGARFLYRRLDHRSGETYEAWERPRRPAPLDQDWTSHVGATLYYHGEDVLKVFTPNWHGIDPETGEVLWQLDQDATYTRFGYFAARHFRGDHAAAASWLRAFDPDGGSDDEVEAWLAGVVNTATEREVAEASDPEEWGPPTDLPAITAAGAPFPIDVLPDWIARHAAQTADVLQVPIDMAAMCALGALSVITSGNVEVELSGAQWREHTNLYLVVAMPPGAGKSPVFKAMLGRPLEELERRLIAASREAVNENAAKRAVYEAEISRLEKKKSEDFQEQLDAAARSATLRSELDDLGEIHPPQLYADDITPEALVQEMEKHDGRMAIISTEGDLFDLIQGQYADRGKTSSLGIYLKGHSGDAVKRQRVSRGGVRGDSVSITRALLSVCVTTQPSVLEALGARAELTRRGLPARFLYALPPSNVGYRDRQKVLEDADQGAAEDYAAHIVALGQRMWGWQSPKVLRTTTEATRRFLEWDQDLEDRQRPGGDLAEMVEWLSKLRACVLRVAGLLAVSDGLDGPDIEIDHLERALTLADYWIDHARAVHEAWSDDGATVKARRCLEWMTTKAGETIKARDLYRARQTLFSDTAAAGEILGWLIDLGWARNVDGHKLTPGKGGVGASVYVRPDISVRLEEAERARSEAWSRGSRGSRVEAVFSSYLPSDSPNPFSPHTPATSATTATTGDRPVTCESVASEPERDQSPPDDFLAF